MSNYSQVVLFTPKDSLAHLDPLKAIRGSQMDTELSLISTAIASKIDTTSIGAASGVCGLTGAALIAAANMPALTGDITTTAGTVATTLVAAGTAGTYTKVTTDAKGRVTSGTTLVAADIPALDTAKITTGTFADARIAQSNVTQHQAALALAASQITSGTFADARIASTNVTQYQSSLALAASQITSGTMATARLGSGTANSTTFLRGDQTYAGITSGNVSGLASSATTDTTNAANISSGTLPSGRLTGTYAISISGNAATATSATSASSATTATNATSATNATNATNTPNITGKAGTTKTLSSSTASGGSDGDIWYQY